MSATQLPPAVFLDRDNTLIHDPGYLRDPGQVRLVDGAADALKRLRGGGYMLVVVSNQSGVARGYLTEEDVAAVHRRMLELLAERGAGVDRIYYCPYLDGPEAVIEAYRRDSELRKPRPGMLLLAARELGIDLSRSWMIGDSERDVDAGRAAGCRAILVTKGGTAGPTNAEWTTDSLLAAAEYILNGGGGGASTPAPPGDRIDHVQGPSSAARPGGAAATGEAMRPETSSAFGRGPNPSGTDALLQQILEELRIGRRERQHEPFSIGQLGGAIAQAFALCAIAWGLYAAVNGATDSALVRLLAGIAFQLIALTWFSARPAR